ncbi:conserved hypothetical protein [Shewanella sediminis HAW-EB3]|uniref:Pilus assembly protein FimV n=1 Tax=Shewanella sediminis (strain HAW-EB3) TaxID=425104 RepID=A8FTT9_SHESH|nr:FimV/HubP family polar landmark protein [Shewanella sediminis]ABV36262.1 conserved hypothetical protein [Shewanella sediminis HAW-EB3]
MNFRTSYLVGLMASALLVFTANPLNHAYAADPLKITGPDGEVRKTNRQYGPTQSSDTFWSIAQRVRPDNSVDIYQVMAAIYDANPHAFSNANYNSLERGMILLIPSKEVMLAIPKSMAKERAARDDKGWRKATATAKTSQPKPVILPETTPSVTKPVTETTSPSISTTATPVTADTADLEGLTAKLEAAEEKALQLTDELARAEDQLNIGSRDTDSLQGKIDELNEQISLLKEQLQISKQQNESLNAEVQMLKEQVATMQQPEVEEDSDLWRSLMGNPLLLILGAAIPALLVLILFWLFLKRRRSEGESEDDKEEPVSESEAPQPTPAPENLEARDDVEAMAVHLDTDEEESIDSLMNIDSSELQPEVDLSTEQDVFVDSGESGTEEQALEEAVEEEGQSLDDLWAEAMGEQDEEEPGPDASADEDDLDSLLAGFDEEPAPVETVAQSNGEIVSADDLDSLLADLDEPATEVETDLSDEIAAELEVDSADDNVSEEDLDSLLASFDAPQNEPEVDETELGTEPDLSDEIAAELEADSADDNVSEEDLDSLLASFDAPAAEAEPEAELTDEIAAELESEESPDDTVSEEDLDSLLASFDAPAVEAESEAELTDEIAAELESEESPDDNVNEEDLDSLLASFDAPAAEAEPEAELTDEIAAELESGESPDEKADEEELDSLLADFDMTREDIEPSLEPSPESELDEDLTQSQAEADTASGKDEALDALLADLESVDNKPKMDPVASKGGSGMFADLKGSKKVDDNSLEWDGSLADFGGKDESPLLNDDELTDSPEEVSPDVSQDLELVPEEVEEKLTVDEALAALDAKEKTVSPAVEVAEHDLTSFQSDNGFIDIDRLLNEADEDVVETDQYKELDVDMGELDSLMGNASMVDVDDEENSVNAKLDLARAYIEIDDTDSAKALLKEVQLDGNERQQSEADGLFKTLD